MPQLDSVVFISSVVWLIIIFVVSYVIYLKDILPKVNFLLKLRLKKGLELEKELENVNLLEELVELKYAYCYVYYLNVENTYKLNYKVNKV